MINKKMLKEIVKDAIKTWGKKPVCECHGQPPETCYGTIYYAKEIPAWQYHLQQVIQKIGDEK